MKSIESKVSYDVSPWEQWSRLSSRCLPEPEASSALIFRSVVVYATGAVREQGVGLLKIVDARRALTGLFQQYSGCIRSI